MVCDLSSIAAFEVAARNLGGTLRDERANYFRSSCIRHWPKRKTWLPGRPGQFLTQAQPFRRSSEFAKALGEARTDVFLLDKYADAVAIDDFAKLAPENVRVRLLAKNGRKDLLKPAINRGINNMAPLVPWKCAWSRNTCFTIARFSWTGK